MESIGQERLIYDILPEKEIEDNVYFDDFIGGAR